MRCISVKERKREDERYIPPLALSARSMAGAQGLQPFGISHHVSDGIPTGRRTFASRQ